MLAPASSDRATSSVGTGGIGGAPAPPTLVSGPRFLTEKDDGLTSGVLVGITNFFDRCSEVTVDGEVHQIIVFK